MLATREALQARAAAQKAAEDEAAAIPSVSDSVAAAFGGKLVLDRIPRAAPPGAEPDSARRRSADVRSSRPARLSTDEVRLLFIRGARTFAGRQTPSNDMEDVQESSTQEQADSGSADANSSRA